MAPKALSGPTSAKTSSNNDSSAYFLPQNISNIYAVKPGLNKSMRFFKNKNLFKIEVASLRNNSNFSLLDQKYLNVSKIQRLDSIIKEINNSFKLDLKQKYGTEHKIHCLNCTDIQQLDECRDYVDYDFNELINIFCCQCNSEL
jgi:hypothetical protein